VVVRESVLHADEVALRRFEDEVAALAQRLRAVAGRSGCGSPPGVDPDASPGSSARRWSGRLGNAVGAPGGPTLVEAGPPDLRVALDLAVVADS
jgi:hypothetical protein